MWQVTGTRDFNTFYGEDLLSRAAGREIVADENDGLKQLLQGRQQMDSPSGQDSCLFDHCQYLVLPAAALPR